MADKTLSDPVAELARLKALLAKRNGRHGFSANCEAIKAKIAEYEARLA